MKHLILVITLLFSANLLAQDSSSTKSSATYIDKGKVNMDVIVKTPGHTYYEVNGKPIHTTYNKNSSYTSGNNKEVFTTGKITPATEAIILHEILKDDKKQTTK